MSQINVLVADDSSTIQKVFELAFENEDINIILTGDGGKALELARQNQPRMVIADVDMPGLDGFELTRELKSGSDTAGIPVYLMSSALDEFDEDRSSEVGASGRFEKPFRSEDMVSKVKEVIASLGEPAVVPVPAPAAPVDIGYDAVPAEEDEDTFEDIDVSLDSLFDDDISNDGAQVELVGEPEPDTEVAVERVAAVMEEASVAAADPAEEEITHDDVPVPFAEGLPDDEVFPNEAELPEEESLLVGTALPEIDAEPVELEFQASENISDDELISDEEDMVEIAEAVEPAPGAPGMLDLSPAAVTDDEPLDDEMEVEIVSAQDGELDDEFGGDEEFNENEVTQPLAEMEHMEDAGEGELEMAVVEETASGDISDYEGLSEEGKKLLQEIDEEIENDLAESGDGYGLALPPSAAPETVEPAPAQTAPDEGQMMALVNSAVDNAVRAYLTDEKLKEAVADGVAEAIAGFKPAIQEELRRITKEMTLTIAEELVKKTIDQIKSAD